MKLKYVSRYSSQPHEQRIENLFLLCESAYCAQFPSPNIVLRFCFWFSSSRPFAVRTIWFIRSIWLVRIIWLISTSVTIIWVQPWLKVFRLWSTKKSGHELATAKRQQLDKEAWLSIIYISRKNIRSAISRSDDISVSWSGNIVHYRRENLN